MSKFIVEVTVTKTEIYHVEADSAYEASELFNFTHYVGCKDENSDMLEVRPYEATAP